MQDIPEKRGGLRILIIGKNSMVAKAFMKMNAQHEIVSVGKEDDITALTNKPGVFDSVIFLAQSADYKSPVFTKDLYDTNIALLYKTLDIVKDITRQFIYFSSGSVYQANETGHYKESDKLHIKGASPYIASKIAGETIVNAYQSVIDSVIVLRPFYMYGEGQKETMLFSSIHRKIKEGVAITLSGNAGLIFNPVHVGDVCRLLENMIATRPQGCHTYNVAGSEIISLRDVVNLMSVQLDVEANVITTDAEPVTCVGILSLTGWSPEVALTEGIQKSFLSV